MNENIQKNNPFLPTPNPKQTLHPIYTTCGFFENFYNSDKFCRNGNQMHFGEQTADHMFSVRYCSAWPEPHEHKC